MDLEHYFANLVGGGNRLYFCCCKLVTGSEVFLTSCCQFRRFDENSLPLTQFWTLLLQLLHAQHSPVRRYDGGVADSPIQNVDNILASHFQLAVGVLVGPHQYERTWKADRLVLVRSQQRALLLVRRWWVETAPAPSEARVSLVVDVAIYVLMSTPNMSLNMSLTPPTCSVHTFRSNLGCSRTRCPGATAASRCTLGRCTALLRGLYA